MAPDLQVEIKVWFHLKKKYIYIYNRKLACDF